jgi:hypothetical protein
MKISWVSVCLALVAGAIWVGLADAARAGTYLVCYLPPDAGQRLIRFCPGSSDATAGQPCQCLLRADSLAGTMTVIDIPDTASAAPSQAMCVPHAQTSGAIVLCPAFHPADGAGCECGGTKGSGPGDLYNVRLMPRVPLRTNQAAAADFLKRLQECCVAK